MGDTPYVLVKCAVSVDGYIDDISNERLILSDKKDFEKVDSERGVCDAILIGAEAVRKDNPRLLIRSESIRKERVMKGLPENPVKVTVTSSGNLWPDLKFFTEGNAKKIVYCGKDVYEQLYLKIGQFADVVSSPDSIVDPEFILKDLAKRNVNKLMIEGGSSILTLFIGRGLVDEIQVSFAPFFVGEVDAPRFVNEMRFPHNKDNRMILENVEKVGDMALLTYKLRRTKYCG